MKHYRNTTWIRINGQAEMRENVRAAIKTAELSQLEAARQSGMTPASHLQSFLSANAWFRRDALEALTHFLGVPAEALVGNSIFANERDRYSEFDHMPPEVAEWRRKFDEQAARQARPVQTRALCCVCGTMRQCAAPEAMAETETDAAGRRATVALDCATCDETTRHALLVLSASKNDAEEQDHAPTCSDLARQELASTIERLQGFNVDVRLRQLGRRSREKERTCSYWFDESKSRWQIDLESNSPPRVQINALDQAWKTIATEDFDNITWDPRTTGTVCTSSETIWAEATDELLADLTRFMPVEKRRTAEHISNEAAR